MVSLSKEEQQRDRRTKMVKRGVFERGKLQVFNITLLNSDMTVDSVLSAWKMSITSLHSFCDGFPKAQPYGCGAVSGGRQGGGDGGFKPVRQIGANLTPKLP